MTYTDRIRTTLAKAGHAGQYDPRHIEAYMRLENPTLDGLGPAQFEREVMVAKECIDIMGPEAEELAASFAL